MTPRSLDRLAGLLMILDCDAVHGCDDVADLDPGAGSAHMPIELDDDATVTHWTVG